MFENISVYMLMNDVDLGICLTFEIVVDIDISEKIIKIIDIENLGHSNIISHMHNYGT